MCFSSRNLQTCKYVLQVSHIMRHTKVVVYGMAEDMPYKIIIVSFLMFFINYLRDLRNLSNDQNYSEYGGGKRSVGEKIMPM